MRVLMVTPAGGDAGSHGLAAIAYLPHELIPAALGIGSLAQAPECDVIVLDATVDLGAAGRAHRQLADAGIEAPLVVTLTEGGMAAASPDWHADDLLLCTAGPAEIEARLRLVVARGRQDDEQGAITVGALTVDDASYTVRIDDRPLDLTFKEFELLRYLVQHPGRVFTRAQLLQDVWGYDYYGGTRTVDVHVRRLRAKLGADFETSIGTVRNVGYRFAPEAAEAGAGDDTGAGDD